MTYLAFVTETDSKRNVSQNTIVYKYLAVKGHLKRNDIREIILYLTLNMIKCGLLNFIIIYSLLEVHINQGIVGINA